MSDIAKSVVKIVVVSRTCSVKNRSTFKRIQSLVCYFPMKVSLCEHSLLTAEIRRFNSTKRSYIFLRELHNPSTGIVGKNVA